MTHHRLPCFARAVVAAALVAWATPARAVDLVLCLDTSGSMQGLIDAARRKLWSLVSELATAKKEGKKVLAYGAPAKVMVSPAV